MRIYGTNGSNTSINGDRDGDGDPDVEIRYFTGTVQLNSGLLMIEDSSNNTIEGLAVTNSPEAGILVESTGLASQAFLGFE